MGIGHRSLLASFLGDKVSTILGAIHLSPLSTQIHWLHARHSTGANGVRLVPPPALTGPPIHEVNEGEREVRRLTEVIDGVMEKLTYFI